MARKNSRTPRDDAPEPTAKNPNPAAAGLSEAFADDTVVERTVTINRPRHELYAFWRDFRNLPLFMENIESVTVIDERRSHWVVRAPADTTVEWDSVITEDIPGELIEWRSNDKASVPNTGRIEFRDSTNGRGTLVSATIAYEPPARRARQGRREAVPGGAEDPGPPGAATLQATHGNRRDRDFAAAVRRAARRVASQGETTCAHSPGKANTTFGWRRCRIRRSSIHAMRSSASPRPRSAARTCISTITTFPA